MSPRGTIVLKSTIAASHEIDLAPLVINEVRVIGSRCGPFPPALRALETGSVDVHSLISERIPLRDGLEALRLTLRNRLRVEVDSHQRPLRAAKVAQ